MPWIFSAPGKPQLRLPQMQRIEWENDTLIQLDLLSSRSLITVSLWQKNMIFLVVPNDMVISRQLFKGRYLQLR